MAKVKRSYVYHFENQRLRIHRYQLLSWHSSLFPADLFFVTSKSSKSNLNSAESIFYESQILNKIDSEILSHSQFRSHGCRFFSIGFSGYKLCPYTPLTVNNVLFICILGGMYCNSFPPLKFQFFSLV